MDDLLTVLTEIPSKVFSTLLTGAILAALAFLSKGVRRTVLYRRHEFELPYSSVSSGSEWDIQWENLRVTLQVAKVHNDYLEEVIVKTNDVNPGMTLKDLRVGKEYVAIAGPPRWFLRIDHIVREKAGGTRSYIAKMSVLRRRW